MQDHGLRFQIEGGGDVSRDIHGVSNNQKSLNDLYYRWTKEEAQAHMRRSKKQTALKLTIGAVKTDKTRRTYWSTDRNVTKLLAYRPSIEDMKLILEPMCYLFIGNAAHLGKKITECDEYFHTLQKQPIEYFLVKYSSNNSSNV
jgi:hypothetical protein